MNKGHKATAGTPARRFVNQTRALLFQAGQGRLNIIDADGDMMNSGPALLEEPGNGRILGHWLEQFDARLPNRQHRNANFLLGYLLGLSHIKVEHVAIEFRGLIDSVCSNANVVDLHLQLVVSCPEMPTDY